MRLLIDWLLLLTVYVVRTTQVCASVNCASIDSLSRHRRHYHLQTSEIISGTNDPQSSECMCVWWCACWIVANRWVCVWANDVEHRDQQERDTRANDGLDAYTAIVVDSVSALEVFHATGHVFAFQSFFPPQRVESENSWSHRATVYLEPIAYRRLRRRRKQI